MDPWVLFPERGYLGFLSILNFYFYLLNFMRCLSRNAGFSLGGGGGDGGFCIQIYRLGQKGDRVLELMNLRPVYISLQLRRNFSLS